MTAAEVQTMWNEHGSWWREGEGDRWKPAPQPEAEREGTDPFAGLPLPDAGEPPEPAEAATSQPTRRRTRPPAEDLDEFMAQQDPRPEFVIPGLLAKRERLILTGPEGGGKSTLARQLGLLPAAGIHPFTGRPMRPIRVLLVDLENSRQQIRAKIGPVRESLGELHGRFRLAVEPHGLDLTLLDDRQWLHSLVNDHQPDLLLIGPMYRLQGDDPGDEDAAKAASRELDKLRLAHGGCALVMEAHTPHTPAQSRKIMRPFGASLWKRWPEFGLYLDANLDKPDDAAPFRPWRGGRDERDWPSILTRSGAGTWDTTETARAATLLDRCRALLADRDDAGIPRYPDGLSQTELAERLKVRKAEVGAMVQEGLERAVLFRATARSPVRLAPLSVPGMVPKIHNGSSALSSHTVPDGSQEDHADD